MASEALYAKARAVADDFEAQGLKVWFEHARACTESINNASLNPAEITARLAEEYFGHPPAHIVEVGREIDGEYTSIVTVAADKRTQAKGENNG